eukprot:403342380
MESIASTVCEGCNKLYDLKSRKPVMILCGHTICETCFHQVCQPQQQTAICPIDHEQIDIIPGKIIYNKSYLKRLEELTPTYKIICECKRQLLCEYLCHQCQIYLCSQCSVLSHSGHKIVPINCKGIDMTFDMLLESADFIQQQLEKNLGVIKEYKDKIYKMIDKSYTTMASEIKTLMMDSKTYFQNWLSRLNYPKEYFQSNIQAEQLRVQNFQTINESNCCLRMSHANLKQHQYDFLKQDIQNLTTNQVFNSLIDGFQAIKFFQKVNNLKRILVVVKTQNQETFAVQFTQNQTMNEITYQTQVKSLAMIQQGSNPRPIGMTQPVGGHPLQGIPQNPFGSTNQQNYHIQQMSMSNFIFTRENFFHIYNDQKQLLIVDNCDQTDQNISTIKLGNGSNGGMFFGSSGGLCGQGPPGGLFGQQSSQSNQISQQNFKVMLIEAYDIS